MPLPLERDAEDVDADAVLLIGDRAMRACLPGFAHAFDLGQEWYDWTGLPFVYAVWAVRRGVDLGGVEPAPRGGQAARPGARRRRSPSARRRASASTPASAAATLATSSTSTSGRASWPGLHHYYTLACELGLARQGVAP